MLSRRFFLGCVLVLGVAQSGFADNPRRLLLLGQRPDGHPATTHEYMAGNRILAKLLKQFPDLDIQIVQADDPWKEGPELVGRADTVVLFLSEGARWLAHDPRRLEAFQKLAARGGGLVALHWAMGTKDAGPIADFQKLLGGCHGGPDRKYKFGPADLNVAEPRHPIATGFKNLHLVEEFYYQLKFVSPQGSAQPVLKASIDGKPETVAWAWERPDGGRSFGFSGLHYHGNWKEESYRRLVAQAVLWVMKKPIPPEGLPVPVTEEDLKLGSK